MAQFEGLLYVKHGQVGTRSEGPAYFLQTRRGDYLLNYEDRQPWQPDFHLEFYCRGMISVTGELIADETIQVRHIRRLSVIRIPEVYPPHRVRFANTSSTEIGDIDLRMFGGESIHIAVLPVAATTDFYELQQLAEGGGAMPPVSNGPSISLGDFEVRYIQGGAQKRIAIRRPSIEITIKFNDDSLSVE